MSGEAKRKYQNEILNISCDIYKRIKKIINALPEEYNLNSIISLYKKCFSVEFNHHLELINNYKKKNDFLLRRGKKSRYDIDTIEKLFLKSAGIRNILKRDFINKRKFSFCYDENIANDIINSFIEKDQKCLQKISKSRMFIQNCDPIYFDKLRGFYEKKKSSILEKELVIDELSKYDGPKTYNFLMKLNDTEHNKDLRQRAFYRIQSLGHYVKLRKEFEGKKDSYVYDFYNPENETLDLVGERIISKSEFEFIKKYNFFISHNIADKEFALKIVHELNIQRQTAYYCWIAENKPGHSKYLKEILNLRMEQSDAYIIVKNKNYLCSKWCKFEMDYIEKSGKPYYIISSESELLSFLKTITF